MHLRDLLAKKQPYELAHFMRSILFRKISGISNENLYNYCLSGTKILINEYYAVINKSLDYLLKSNLANKYVLFKELK